jgi:prephenate dehydratase/chorismate mutase/prephenate dehydratase
MNWKYKQVRHAVNLNEIRNEIDLTDSKILRLLSKRMGLALQTRKLKTRVQDSQREREVLEKIRTASTGLLDEEFTTKIFEEVIKHSRHLQQKVREIIAFQGESGAYGEVASKEWNPDYFPVPSVDFASVFDGVQSGLYDYGIVPVENTLGGAVEGVNQLLIHTGLHVVGAVELPVHHCLLARPGTDHREIRAVYSHPQALSQCRDFIARNKLEAIPYRDTAGAAKMVSEERPKGVAAIASKLAARLYNLEIIKENIESLDRNMTRFLVLSTEENKEDGDKCSIIFSTEHKAGTLFRVLEVFAKRNLNLTRIESIPHEPGNYAFFVDFMGSRKDERVLEALDIVKEITTGFKLKGCYREKKIV